MVAEIMPSISLNALPTPGALLGTQGTRDIIDRINSSMNMGQEFFGSVNDLFQKGRSVFMQSTIEPIRNITYNLTQTANKILKNDVIIPLKKEKDFTFVPPCMQEPIIMYEPVRKLFEQGRVSGFGFDPDNLPEEDVWGRLINNGVVESVFESMDDDGRVELNYTWYVSDPDPSFEELDYVETTRHAIDKMLANTDFDPTCYPLKRF